MEAKEGIVLDQNGNTIHDPTTQKRSHGQEHIRFVFNGGRPVGLLPKLVLGAALIALLFLASGVAVFVLGFLALSAIVRGLVRAFR